jgi:hypothetical protein
LLDYDDDDDDYDLVYRWKHMKNYAYTRQSKQLLPSEEIDHATNPEPENNPTN